MQLDSPLSSELLQKAMSIALSFLDDVLIFAATKAGLHLPWLQGLTSVLWILTLSYWAFQICRFCYERYYRYRV